MEDLRDVFTIHFPEQFDKPESLSRVSAMATTTLGGYFKFRIFDREFWTSWIEPGNDGYVFGVKGSGKTDFMCLLAEMYIAQGGTVVSGIPLLHEVDGYIYCSKGSSLLETSCRLSLEGVDCFVLLDEGFFAASGESPLKPDVINVRQFFRLGRKLGIASAIGSQRESDILRDIRSTAAIRVEKVDRHHPDRAYVEIRGQMDGEAVDLPGFFIRGVPSTSLPFKTEGIGAFQMDFEPNRLMKYLSDLPMEENQFEASIRWLNDRGFYFSREEKVYLARRMKRQGISSIQVGRVLGEDDSTVRNWWGGRS